MKVWLLLAILCLLPCGCSLIQRDEQAQGHVHTRERTITTQLANGGTAVVRELDTDTDEQRSAHSGLDDALAANLSGVAKVGASIATGDWGAAIGVGGTMLAAAAAGWAKSKQAQAEAHKADADDAWERVAARADMPKAQA